MEAQTALADAAHGCGPTRRGARIASVWAADSGFSGGFAADADGCEVFAQPPPRARSEVRAWLSRLSGAFAIAFSPAPGRLLLACDALGQRSLYYSLLADGRVVFGSTLRGVLDTGLVARRLRRATVPYFLTFAYVPGAHTLVEGVFALPPGCMLEATASGLHIEPFWSLPATPAKFRGEAELTAQLREALDGAVARALPPAADGVGVTLSGGIDSSLVLAIARRRFSGPMHCYSVSFGPEHANELAFSGMVAEHTGVPQVIVEISPAHVVAELDATVAALSQPNGDPLTVPNTLLFRRAAADSCVLLNGEGGDPCFGGPKNAPMLLAELLGSGAPESSDGFERARSYLRAHQKCYDDLPHMLAPALREELSSLAMEREVSGWLDDPRWPSLLDKLMAINVAWKGAYHILPKVDHLSFGSGVCARSPLFDRRIVELSFQIPAGSKRKGAVEKHLLKQAVSDLLPRAILDRPKSGMLVPVEAWFRGPLRQFARERLLEGLAPWELFDRRWLEAIIDGKLPGLRPRRGVKIWLLLTLEAWLRGVLR